MSRKGAAVKILEEQEMKKRITEGTNSKRHTGPDESPPCRHKAKNRRGKGSEHIQLDNCTAIQSYELSFEHKYISK